VGGIGCCNGLEDGFVWVKDGFDNAFSCGFETMEVGRGKDDCGATMVFLAATGCLMGCDTVPNVCDTPSVGGLNGPQFWVDGSEDFGDLDAAMLDPSSIATNVLLVL
jgi:hypothetical protein